MIFGQNVQKIRKERNISQEKLAELAGLHVTYIGRIERQKQNISIDNIEKISDALNVSAAILFEEDLV